jgi:hypothetical protein
MQNVVIGITWLAVGLFYVVGRHRLPARTIRVAGHVVAAPTLLATLGGLLMALGAASVVLAVAQGG